MRGILVFAMLCLTLVTTNLYAGYVSALKETPKYVEKVTGKKVVKKITRMVEKEIGDKVLKDKLKGKDKILDIIISIVELLTMFFSTIGLYRIMIKPRN